jgi:hypothetical protein
MDLETQASAAPATTAAPVKRWRWLPSSPALIWVFGVLLPIVAIVFESITGLCRDTFFDPLPTVFHTALFGTIPLANGRLALALGRNEAGLPRPWAWLHAFALGVAIVYSIVFLPIMPMAVIGILFLGIGGLGLAPVCALICAMLGRRAMKARTGQPIGVLGYGIALAVAMLIAVDAPTSLTRIGVHMATDTAPDTRMNGIKLLRAVGSEDLLLRLCYNRSGRSSDFLALLLDSGHKITPEQVRTVFYQVTGEPFNSRPPPGSKPRSFWGEDSFDDERGGDVVGGRVKNVHLIASRIDGSVDAIAALAYMEWTMELRNASSIVQEGRAQIALPPGAVVSRATLWINGEEREAAFGGRAVVRAAYESVVRQSRDPLLVTTAGADRVLVQMFPIPPGGTMKIRIGISAPLGSDVGKGVHLQMPSIGERNFELAPELRHAVWFESPTPLQGSAGLKAEAGPDGTFAVRGMLAEPLPGQTVPSIEAPSVTPAALAWSFDDKNKDGQVVVQTRTIVPVEAPGRVAVVIDGSYAMRGARQQLVDALAAFPPEIELGVVFAGDDKPSLVLRKRGESARLIAHLKALEFVGGRDSVAALGVAWDWASEANGQVVWIHGTQPVEMDTLSGLQQRIDRRAGQVTLHDVALDAGPNLIAQKLNGLTPVARRGSLATDLQRLFDGWKPGARRVMVTRERRAPAGIAAEAKTSPHLARLWAAAWVKELSGQTAQQKEAVQLAVQYQLVTPVSGAVVLETQAEYDAAGLEPVAPGSVPTIPEPETWALMIVVMLALLWRRRRQTA